MSLNSYTVKGVFVGKAKILPNGQESGIHKQPIETLHVYPDRIDHDEVVDQKYHGGNMRVIHHYSEKNYAHLKQKFPEIADRFIPGSFGENLYTEELTEADLCIGDIFTLGTAKVQLTVPRRPCATINQGYEDNRVLKEVMNSGHVGWFYCVLEAGEVKVGDKLIHIERPFPELKVTELFAEGYGAPKFKRTEFLQKCWDTGLMDKGWKPKLEKALFS